MSEEEEVEVGVPPEDASWPLAEALASLEAFAPERIRGVDRLGSLAFGEAPEAVEEIAEMIRDLGEENWRVLDDQFRTDVQNQATALVNLIQNMIEMEAGAPNAQEQRNAYAAALVESLNWFRANVRPRLLEARLRRERENAPVLGVSEADSAELRKELADLREQAARLGAELMSVSALVEAGRAAVGESGATDLAADYAQQANDHRDSWKRWRWGFAASMAVSVIGTLLVVLAWKPSGDATSAAAVSRFLLDLLVIGLLLYLVRITSLQFRVHRHLEAVSRSKAAALSTFSRIIASGAEPSTRDALATTLAQAVFTPGETGFIDASNDHITLIERVVGSVAQRASGGS